MTINSDYNYLSDIRDLAFSSSMLIDEPGTGSLLPIQNFGFAVATAYPFCAYSMKNMNDVVANTARAVCGLFRVGTAMTAGNTKRNK